MQLVHSRERASNSSTKSKYGFKPDIKSYHLRCLFFNLLVHVNNTTFAEQLNSGFLAVCLLDMVYRVASIDDSPIYIPEPLTNSFIKKKIKNERLIEIKVLLQTLLDCHLEDIEKFKLLNTKGIPIITRLDFISDRVLSFRPLSAQILPDEICNFLSDEDNMRIKFHIPHGHVYIKRANGKFEIFSKTIPVLSSILNDDDDELDCCSSCCIM